MNAHGGKRRGAGRPRGSNAYGEPTVPVRIPKSRVISVKAFLAACKAQNDRQSPVESIVPASDSGPDTTLPLFSTRVQAGFPSPADDHIEKRLNLNDYLIKQADATFLVTITGLSMRDAGLLPKDVVVVDRSRTAGVGNIVMAVVDGEFTIKYLGLGEHGNPLLIPANPEFKAIEIKEGMQFEIWGVVTGSVRKYL
ncbi:MAG: peptidase S24 [Methylobacter sp.]|nr:MAG: peptidase S24 [Methylobacter sp.]PPD03929.1 MAG: peptidase S24 [Methylobacter sp.]PPD22690.1 MAG: peptidase S24 [Methylobacter sp.]PPD33908.1 MAG: peptidase S24 [Methylomonas sp.]